MSSAVRIAYGDFGRVALLDMDRSLVRHAHPHCHVLLKVEGADTAFTVGNRLVPLSEGNAVLVNAWEPHAYVHVPKSAATVILALYIEPQWLQLIHKSWVSSSAPQFFQSPSGEITPRIRKLAMTLAEQMVHDPGGRVAQEKLLSELMISTIERFAQWRAGASVSILASANKHRIDWRIRRALDVIRTQPRGVTMDQVAKEAGLSRSHFYRLFQRNVDVSPHVYMNVFKMEMAVRSIVDSNDCLSTLSGNLGFSAPSHFSRFFRENAGVTPSEFRSVTRMGLSAQA
ncbi:MAG: AraC family transcriptional regulator [Hyphomicrobiales bacterium]|nr:MAG: AraC family transcriptional regulator [Hyphomicrobiales bacterium]